MPGDALVATAKLPVTIPDPEIVHEMAGEPAKITAPPAADSVQLRELPVGNPPPVRVIAVPSSVPYPGAVMFGETAMEGEVTFWKRAHARVTFDGEEEAT